MNLWSKAVLLLLFNEVIVKSEDQCISKGSDAGKCVEHKFGHKIVNLILTRSKAKNNSEDLIKCCADYYFKCIISSIGCNTWLGKTPKQLYEEVMKKCSNDSTSPTKNNCVKLHKKVTHSNCKQYEVSVCEDYSWNSFAQISVNVFIVSVLVFISLISNSYTHFCLQNDCIQY